MDEVRGEPRWPMSLAIVFVIVLIILLPERATSLPKWAFVMALAVLNATTLLIHDLIVGSPSTKRADRPCSRPAGPSGRSTS